MFSSRWSTWLRWGALPCRRRQHGPCWLVSHALGSLSGISKKTRIEVQKLLGWGCAGRGLKPEVAAADNVDLEGESEDQRTAKDLYASGTASTGPPWRPSDAARPYPSPASRRDSRRRFRRHRRRSWSSRRPRRHPLDRSSKPSRLPTSPLSGRHGDACFRRYRSAHSFHLAQANPDRGGDGGGNGYRRGEATGPHLFKPQRTRGPLRLSRPRDRR